MDSDSDQATADHYHIRFKEHRSALVIQAGRAFLRSFFLLNLIGRNKLCRLLHFKF